MADERMRGRVVARQVRGKLIVERKRARRGEGGCDMYGKMMVTVLLLGWGCPTAWGDAQVTTIVEGLDNPCGVAIQPETGHVFVSDSGAGRVVRIVDGQVREVIVGFPTEPYGKDPVYIIGPLGLLFLDRDTLVVGGGGLPDGEDQLQVFSIPVLDKGPIQAGEAAASFKLAPGDGLVGEGNFYALAATTDAVYVTSNGDDSQGWVGKAPINGAKLTAFDRFLNTKERVGVNAPVAATISPRGELVIGQMGEVGLSRDSLLTFYGLEDGKLLMKLNSGLMDIVALAYSSQGQLLALDFAGMKPEEGGLFQLVAVLAKGNQEVEARKVVPLHKPTAMAVGADGSFSVTVFGMGAEGDAGKSGRLLNIKLE